MNIGILIFSDPVDERAAGAARLEEAARARGYEAVRLYEPFFTFHHAGSKLEILYDDKPLPPLDAIIARPNFVEEPSLHTITTDLLARAGYPILNRQPTFSLSKNKLAQHVRLSESGIPMPTWAVARTPAQAYAAAERIGYPLIIKVPFGTWGKGVFYAERTETLWPIVDYLAVRDKNPVILEKFIAEANGTDLRVFVVAGKVVASMERTARAGDVRANASIGGTGRAVELTAEEKDLALRAATSFDLDIAGVDILRSSQGPLVIEVNANPGFSELEKATGIDVAGAIIDAAVAIAENGEV